MILGLVLLLVTLGLRLWVRNRHLRGRLTFSMVILALQVIVAAMLASGLLSAGLQESMRPALPLLLSLGISSAIVALAVNPWKADTLPDRFPTIVQDTIVIVLFALAATMILQERVFATTAVGAVVIGFALQDTLGNLFAGLAIQVEQPFRVGHWVRIADTDGQVSEITWRATKIRTKAGNFVIVPNSTLSKDTITNYSEPTPESRIEIEVGASYDAAPNQVKAAILEAIRDEPLIAGSRTPEVLLVDFAASAITYRVRVWTTDFAADERLRDRLRSAIYYAFRRSGIAIPYPTQVEISAEPSRAIEADPPTVDAALRRVAIFAPLDDEQRRALATTARVLAYAAGEAVVRQGDTGASMFVIASGTAVVFVDPGNQEVARLEEGMFFGEMSLLTGAPRNATVRAASDLEVFEFTAAAFRRFVLANPSAVEQIGAAAAQRAAELQRARQADAAPSIEPAASVVGRIRRFLKI